MTLRSLNLTVVGLTAFFGLALGAGNAMAGQTAGGSAGESKFRAMDTNNDGRISREEHEEGAERRFEAMDTNDDDKVTVEEMETAREKMMAGKKGKPSGMTEMTVTEKIQKMDTNADGVLSEDEHEAGAKMMFDRMDANGDGFLTKTELEAGHKKMMEKKSGKTGNQQTGN